VTRYWNELVLDVGERAERPITEADLTRWIVARAEMSMRAAPDLHEEVRGISEGAEVPYEVALGMIHGEEAAHLAMSLGRGKAFPAGVPDAANSAADATRCLSLTVPGTQTQSESTLLAQTWDAPPWIPDPVILVVEEVSGISAFMADPGWNGGAGANNRGLGSVHTGTLLSEAREGLPYPFIARRILQRGTVDDAAASVSEFPSMAGCHYIVSDGGRTVDVEAAGTVSARLPHEGLQSTCAHFNDRATIAQQASPNDPVSLFRVSRLLYRAAGRGQLGPLDVLAVYDDHHDGPEHGTVCLHPGRSRTVGTIVVEPATHTIWANAGNPCENRPVRRVTLTEDGFETEVVETTAPGRQEAFGVGQG
jgi:hypothetical protein